MDNSLFLKNNKSKNNMFGSQIYSIQDFLNEIRKQLGLHNPSDQIDPILFKIIISNLIKDNLSTFGYKQ